MAARAWVEVRSLREPAGLVTVVKVELVIQDDQGNEARHEIPDVASARWEVYAGGVPILHLGLYASIDLKTEVRTDLTSAEDLLAIIAAGRLVGKD